MIIAMIVTTTAVTTAAKTETTAASTRKLDSLSGGNIIVAYARLEAYAAHNRKLIYAARIREQL
jgi:hypothetical protein